MFTFFLAGLTASIASLPTAAAPTPMAPTRPLTDAEYFELWGCDESGNARKSWWKRILGM